MVRDATAGVFSRASFVGRLREEVERAHRQGRPLSLLLIDLDYFKSVNDAFGHTRGDEILVDWTQRLRASIRANDLPFRYGGDEFVVLLPGAPAAQARALAQRILAETRSQPFGTDPPLTLSVSIGVATLPDHATDHEQLFQLADLHLMDAKRLGRGRVVDGAGACSGGDERVGTSRLVGRDHALRQMQTFLAGLPRGRRGLLSVVGAPGSGRTRFLQEVGQTARLLGHTVLCLGRGNRDRGPFQAIRQACDSLPSAREAPRTVEGWVARLRALSGKAPGLLITVDDPEGIDEASLDVLRAALRETGDGALGVVIAGRDPAVGIALAGDAPRTAVELQPLDKDALRVWTRGYLQWEPPERLLDWLLAVSEGLPRRVASRLGSLQETGLLRKDGAKWVLTADLPEPGGTPHAAAERSVGNLPALLTSFVGRTGELQAVWELLLASSRLATLVGAGGIGKTRLAIEAGSALQERYPDGVWLVELAALTDPALIVEEIAAALGLVGESDRATEATLIAHLQSRTALLLLDNCEHLIEGAAGLVERLLKRCSRLSVLSTSRESLGVPGESLFRVPPLSFPAPGEEARFVADPESFCARFESVRLFLHRAAQTHPPFELTAENIGAVVEICRQLDGIPLALELAAARTGLLSVHQIAARLQNRFRLLRGGSRTALPRQQTLKSLVDWSYDLLTEEERRLLRALSVFSGGCTLDAVEALGVDLGDQDPLEVLARLVDKSLLQMEAAEPDAHEPHYQMLETIRQYARDRLVEAGEEERCRRLHLEYCLRFARRAERELLGPRQRAWLDRVEANFDNLRAALEFARQQDPEAGLELAGCLPRFLQVRRHASEGREIYSALLAAHRDRTPGAPGHAVLKSLQGAGQLAHLQHDSAAAIRYLTEAATLAEQLGDVEARIRALCQLGYPQHESGDVEGRPRAGRRVTGSRCGRTTGGTVPSRFERVPSTGSFRGRMRRPSRRWKNAWRCSGKWGTSGWSPTPSGGSASAVSGAAEIAAPRRRCCARAGISGPTSASGSA